MKEKNYKVVFDIKNEDRVDELTKKLMVDQYTVIYNGVYCTLANSKYYERLNNDWDKAHPNGYEQEEYMAYIFMNNMQLCDTINTILYDSLMTYKVDPIDVNFVGVLKDDPEVEITFYLEEVKEGEDVNIVGILTNN